MILKKYIILFIILVAGLYACGPGKLESPPNIIFIMSDDHASKAISAYDTSLIRTPNIDRLAEHGIRFDNCFCTNAICAPSRAVILTGKYSHMNGVIDNSRSFDGEQQTLPKLLQQAGYQTAIVGKWHLKSNPTGFDHWLVLPGQGQYYKPDFKSQEGRISIDGYVTDIITEKGIEFLENRDAKKPFFLMLHHKAPHRNWQPAMRHLEKYDGVSFPVPDNFQDTYIGKSIALSEPEMSISTHMSLDYDLKMTDSLVKRKGLEQELFFSSGDGNIRKRMGPEDFARWKSYYKERLKEYNSLENTPETIDEWKYQQYMEDYLSCITTVDENIGILLDYLEQSGLDENTIVIYTSDQGFFLGEHGWFDKRFMYEESHRMPLLIRSPYSGSFVDEHMITNADFAPTILELAGLETPGDMQGESFGEMVRGKDPEGWRDAVYYHYFEYPAEHAVKRHYGIRSERYKLIHFYYDIDEWEFYDLMEDPKEMSNLYADPGYQEVIIALKEKLHGLREEYKDTDPHKFLPTHPDTIHHLGMGKPYILRNMPSSRYPGEFMGLTNGVAYPEGESYQIGRDKWCGFQGNDFIIEIDLIEPVAVSKIKAGFLQDQISWIFLPQELEFHTSLDGDDYMVIPVSMCNEITEDNIVMKMNIEAQYSGEKIRYIKIIAKNNIIPEWHMGDGKPAWLFVDEVVVLD